MQQVLNAFTLPDKWSWLLARSLTADGVLLSPLPNATAAVLLHAASLVVHCCCYTGGSVVLRCYSYLLQSVAQQYDKLTSS